MSDMFPEACSGSSARSARSAQPRRRSLEWVVVSAVTGELRGASGAHAPLRRFAASRLFCIKLAGGTRKLRAVKEFNVQYKVNLNSWCFIVQFSLILMCSMMIM